MISVPMRDFSGGQDTSSATLSCPENASRKMLGLYPFKSRSRMDKVRGPRTAATSASPIYAFTRFKTAASAGYVYTYLSGSDSKLFSTTAGAVIYTGTAGVNFTYDASFAQVTQGGTERLYVASPGGSLLVWWEALATAQVANWVAPLVAPTVAVTGTGVLDPALDTTPYYEYVYTYVLASGTETNSTTASARIVPALQRVNVTVTWDTTAGIPTISSANIYRRGGTVSDFYLVANVPNSGGATATYQDNIADADLSATAVAPRNNFPAPSGMKRVKLHNNRLWGYTTSSNVLYFSGLSQYGVWGQSSTGYDLEGGLLTMEGPGDDSIISVESLGSVLVIGRKNSLYALVGNNFDEFVLSKRSSIGLISEFAMARVYNHVYYLGVDFRVYRVGNSDPEWVSGPIQSDLDTYQVFLSGVTGAKIHPEVVFAEGVLYVNIPSDTATGASRTWGFRVSDGAWFEVSGFGAPPVSYLGYGVGLKTARGTHLDTGGLPVGADEVACLSFDRLNILLPLHYDSTSTAVSWKSREIVDPTAPQEGRSLYRLDHLYIDGDAVIDMTDSSRLKLKVYVDGSVAATYEIGSGSGTSTSVTPTLCDFRMPAAFVGRAINVALEGNAKSLTVREVVPRVEKVRDWHR